MVSGIDDRLHRLWTQPGQTLRGRVNHPTREPLLKNSQDLLPTISRIVPGSQYHCDNYEAAELSVLRHKSGGPPVPRVWMTTLLQDMRYALRVLRKNPGFAIVAVLSLALGVGANTAIFSIVNAVLLRSLPFSHPERLVKIVASNRGVGARDIGLSVPAFDDLRSRADVFEQFTVPQGGPTNLTGGERPQHLELLEVSPNYFSMLGTSAHLGRVFGPGDEAEGFAEAAMISDSLWARGF